MLVQLIIQRSNSVAARGPGERRDFPVRGSHGHGDVCSRLGGTAGKHAGRYRYSLIRLVAQLIRAERDCGFSRSRSGDHIGCRSRSGIGRAVDSYPNGVALRN
jgi:hypothetical protein